MIMNITYTVADYETEDKTVEVTYTNDAGLIHKRQINIPHLEDGSIDENYLQEILEGQLLGVENKIKIGVIQFTDPNLPVDESDPAVGIASTSI
jgi:hypothetical protein